MIDQSLIQAGMGSYDPQAARDAGNLWQQMAGPAGYQDISAGFLNLIPGFSQWQHKKRMGLMDMYEQREAERRQAAVQMAQGLLGQEALPFDQLGPESTMADFAGSGLLSADPQEQRMASLGLMSTPGYEALGRDILNRQLGFDLQDQRTTAMKNLEAAGYDLNTPQGQAAMREYLMKPAQQTTINMPNQAERTAAAWAGEAIQAQEGYQAFEDAGYVPSFMDDKLADVPFIGNYLTSPEYKQARTNAGMWIQANLRPESGAVISPKEEENYYNQFFPQPGDDPQTVSRKAELRKQKLLSRAQQAGRAAGEIQTAPRDTSDDDWEYY